MHTYRKRGTSWEVGFQRPSDFNPIGPKFFLESQAAAFASFMNGGRYCPDEIELIFAVPVDDGEHKENWPEDHTTPPSKGRFADYPHEERK